MDLSGKTALVTGGARRIGAAISLALAERGARVAIHCRTSRAETDALAARCPGSVVLQADLGAPEAPARLVAGAWERLGHLDVLVNNASTWERMPPEEVTVAAWDRTLAVNLRAPFFLARDAGLRMRARGSGVIVNLTDWAVERPYAAYLPYFAAKAGLASSTAGLARAFAPQVRVNAIAPGPIVLREDTPPGQREAVERAVPLGRLGGTDAIVSAVMFLIGNDFVTGTTITVDGGRSLR